MLRGGNAAAPTIYLNYLYELYNAEENLEECYGEVKKLYEEGKRFNLDTSKLLDFEQVKCRVVYKLVNYEKNKEKLVDMPHRKILDLAITYYLDIQEGDAGIYTVEIKNELLNLWQVTEEILFQLAEQNTKRLMPVELQGMDCVMQSILEAHGVPADEVEELMEAMGESEFSLFVLSNVSWINGAAAMLYRDVLKNFADMVESDLYVLPSSVHEVLLLIAEVGEDIGRLQEMVAAVNSEEVPEMDVLSNSVYRYSRKTGRLEVVAYAV